MQSNNKTINVWLCMQHWICTHEPPVELTKIEHEANKLLFPDHTYFKGTAKGYEFQVCCHSVVPLLVVHSGRVSCA